MDKLLGNFVWHELMTSDKQSGADFFAKVAGWGTQGTPVDPNYRLFTRGGQPVAGLMDIPPDAKAMGAKPSWVTYIGTPDVDDLVRQAESLGAKIFREPTDIPTIGRFAVIQDPQGAVFMGFTPAPMEGDMRPPKPAFVWHELLTTDVDAAFDFYHRLFGWVKTDSMTMEPIGIYQMYGLEAGQSMGGIFKLPAGMQAPPHWLPYIGVADARKVAPITEGMGGTVTLPPMQVPDGGWITNGLDLQGAAFAVYSEAEAAPQAARPAAKKPAKTATKPAAKKSAKKAPAKPAKKTPKQAVKKAVKKAAPARKAKAANKPAKKSAVKKSAKKSAAKKAAKKAPARKPAKKKAKRARR